MGAIFKAVKLFLDSYWKYLVGITVSLVVWYSIAHYGQTRFDAGVASVHVANASALEKQVKEQATEVVRLNKLAEDTRTDLEKAQHDLADARALRPSTVIRVCNGTNDRRRVPAIPGAAGGTIEDARGQLQQANAESAVANFDTKSIYSVTDEADDEHVECNALKAWARSIKKSN